MQTSARKLHPLLTAAAVSITAFSAVGVAALAGLIPHSKGSAKEETPVAAAEMPAALPESTVAPQSAPAPKPVKKHVARVAASKPAEPVIYREFTEVARAPQVVEAPKPVLKPGIIGTVESVREVEVQGKANGVGAAGGSLAGAVIGHNIGDHSKLVTVLGAAGGALLGNQIERQARATKHWEMTLRFDDGTTQSITSNVQPYWRQGDRVRIFEGKLQPV